MPPHSTGRNGHPARRDRWVAVASVLVMVLSARVLVAALRHDLPMPTTSPSSGSAAGTTLKTGTADRHRTRPTTPRRGAVAGAHRRGDAGARAPRRGAVVRAHWRRVLARLDRRRARAYATTRAGLLRRVYTPRSSVLQRDRALLLRYRRRGLHVQGMRMRVRDLKVRTRRREHVVLVVRERLGGATVRARGSPRRLPADDVDRHVVALRRVEGAAWRIASVR